MAVAPDPIQDRPLAVNVDLLVEKVAAVRDRMVRESPPPSPSLSQFGWSVVDHIGVRVADLLPRGMTPDVVKKLCEEIGRRFLTVVLPTPEECELLDAKPVVAYLAAVGPDKPDASLLSAAYGSARLRVFRGDRRLVYRTAGYRGQLGDPLADHLFAEVVRPAVQAVTA